MTSSPPDSASAARTESGDLDPACADAQRMTRRFLAHGPDGPSPSELTAMRGHLAACPECDAIYRQEAVFVARLGHENRRTRERKGEVSSSTPRARFGATLPNRRQRLRLVLVPAFLIFLFLQSDRLRGNGGYQLAVLEGTVIALERELDASTEDLHLPTGESCATLADGRALLSQGDMRLTLGPETEVIVGSDWKQTLRLTTGTVHARGPCTLHTVFGVVDIASDAVARVEIDAAGLDVECLTGDVRVQDASGERTIAPAPGGPTAG